MKTNLDAALEYLGAGYSVIPCGTDKKPLVSWKEYQQRRPDRGEVLEWWANHPKGNVGIITGRVSGLCVIDVDTDAGKKNLEPFIPDSLTMPISLTPRGGMHMFFKMPDENIGNNAGLIPGCDFRGEGGYVVAPPSTNGNAKAYTWMPGLSIDEIEAPALPLAYIKYIFSRIGEGYKTDAVNANNCQQVPTSDNKMFVKGSRDNDLFHVANCLIKGGCKDQEARQVLEILAKNCNPPFSQKELDAKIQSALNRSEVRDRNLTQEIRDLIMTTSGNITTTFVYNCQHLTTRDEKKKAQVILGRLVQEGLLERTGTQAGVYRRVESECEGIDFQNATDEVLNIRWPFNLERLVEVMPGNIVVIAGEPNAGKTAFLLNFARMNLIDDVYYFSSEMGSRELRKRLVKFGEPLSAWSRLKAKERTSNFGDVIKPDSINIIDFLEVYDEFYKVGGMIREIYDKLNRGVAVIAIQKNIGTDYGLGGMRGLEKPRLYLAMQPGKMKVIKAKNWATARNPNGLEINYKLIDGCKFIASGDWQRE